MVVKILILIFTAAAWYLFNFLYEDSVHMEAKNNEGEGKNFLIFLKTKTSFANIGSKTTKNDIQIL